MHIKGIFAMFDLLIFIIKTFCINSYSEFRVWSDKDAKALFQLRTEREPDFVKSKNHKTLWNSVADTLCQQGVIVDGMQCANKWKSLKREWRKSLDHNSKSGNDPKKSKFYDELCELYGHKAAAQPTALLDTLNPSNAHQNADSGPATKKMRKERRAPRSATMTWLNEYQKSQEKYREQQAERLEEDRRQRREESEAKLALFERLVSALEKK